MNAEATATTRPTATLRHPWWPIVGCIAVVLAAQLALFRRIIDSYFPTLDEISVQVGSTPIGGPIEPAWWFTHGFHDYYIPYPEWSASGTDFWRPLVNVYYWASYQMFGDHWSDQLIVGYAAHAIVVGLTCYLALSVLRLNLWLSAAAVLIAIFNPAYVHQDAFRDPFLIPRAVQYPIYQIEVFAALLVMLSLLAFLSRRFWIFSLLVTLALLFNETAISVPLSALALTGVWLSDDRRQSWKNLAWLVAPLLVWSAGRVAMLQYAASGIQQTSSTLVQWILQCIRHLLLWPTGLFQTPVAEVKSAVSAHHWSLIAAVGADIAVNLAWWAVLGFAVVLAARKWAPVSRGHVPEPWVSALVFSLGNLIFALALPSSELRYGYLWFALGPAAMFGALSPMRGGVGIALVLTASLVVPQLRSLADALSRDSVNDFSSARGSARQLANLLGSLPPRVTTAFLVDDLAVQTSSPAYFAKFSGFRGRLILINNLMPIRGCRAPSGTAPQYRLTRDAAGARSLQYQAPECFQRAWNMAPLELFDQDKSIRRGESMTYHYPDLSPQVGSNGLTYEPGRRFSVRSNDPACAHDGDCVWLGFDAEQHHYYVLPLETAPSEHGN